MNVETVQRPGDNEPLILGTEFRVCLRDLAHDRTAYSIEQLIAVLEMTKTLTSLAVHFSAYNPTPENNRRIVEPLCRCLSNLRCRNEHHRLCGLHLRYANFHIHGGMSNVFQQFLIAAKQCGISHLELFEVHHLPVQFLVDFCRGNRHLKFLEVNFLLFSDGGAAMSLPPKPTQDSSVILVLDKLFVFGDVSFENSTAATGFADLIACMTVKAMKLGKVWTSDDDVDDNDRQLTKRILSEIKMPSVNQLEWKRTCRVEHFKAALEAGTTSIVDLDVVVDYDKDDYSERLELLANYIRCAVQLSSLALSTLHFRNRPFILPREFLRAIEACATVTQIEVIINRPRGFSSSAAQPLEGFRIRNQALAGFVASPDTYPTDKLLWLMSQFDNCSMGRYMLARILPVVLSFEMIKSTDSSTTEPNSIKRKISEAFYHR